MEFRGIGPWDRRNHAPECGTASRLCRERRDARNDPTPGQERADEAVRPRPSTPLAQIMTENYVASAAVLSASSRGLGRALLQGTRGSPPCGARPPSNRESWRFTHAELACGSSADTDVLARGGLEIMIDRRWGPRRMARCAANADLLCRASSQGRGTRRASCGAAHALGAAAENEPPIGDCRQRKLHAG